MLIIGDTTTPFLHESELPDYARLNSLPGSVVSMDEDRQLAEALQRSATDAPQAGVSPGEYLLFLMIISEMSTAQVDPRVSLGWVTIYMLRQIGLKILEGNAVIC